jgi:hypothetical protein
MFELAVRYLGDDEQVKFWLPLITNCRIIGNYSQTELGHGSNVRVSQNLLTSLITIKIRVLRLQLYTTNNGMDSSLTHLKIQLLSSGQAILVSLAHTV